LDAAVVILQAKGIILRSVAEGKAEDEICHIEAPVRYQLPPAKKLKVGENVQNLAPELRYPDTDAQYADDENKK